MLYLAYAYASGIGVIKNLEESIKWLYLSKAATPYAFGSAKEVLKEIEEFYPGMLVEVKSRSLEKAKLWMEQHPDAFFNQPTTE
ncbi:MAG: SEL1-like repeat protein [Verrucomicrobia bacterium]|nr:SEL1-like repeat protein [Verrucomicrobiota bacterium]